MPADVSISVNCANDAAGQEIAALASRTAVLIGVAALIEMGRATARYIPKSSTDAINTGNTVAGLMERK